MSKRRNIGDRIWLALGAGFGASQGEWATIPDTVANRDGDPLPCCLDCGDEACAEWDDVWPDSGRNACHVPECQMFDGPQSANAADAGDAVADGDAT